jgi:chitinase
MTAAVASQPSLIAALAKYFDHIYIMTYDFSGAWPGWVTWHNSPVKDGGGRFPGTGRPLPSVDRMVDDFIAAGAPKRKLGIGIDFYGYVWSGGSGTPTVGASAPGQSWTTPPQVTPNVPYFTIYKDYFRPEYYRWDTLAQAAYLSVHPSPDLADKFVSYDDEHTCRSKVEYAVSKGIGGVFIWELGGGYLPGTFSERDRLLQAVKQATAGGQAALRAPLLESPPDAAKIADTNPVFRWHPVPGATSYLIQISSDSSFTSMAMLDSVISDTLAQVRNAKAGSTFYWRVGARNTGATSPFSNTWTFQSSR